MYFMQPPISMAALCAGALFGVAIPAVLLNVPGSAAAVGTTFDGFPMAQAGRHNEALGLALAASCSGQAAALLVAALPRGADRRIRDQARSAGNARRFGLGTDPDRPPARAPPGAGP